MTAYTQRYVTCDRCNLTFQGRAGRGTGPGIGEVRKAARKTGWTHPDGWSDLCPACTTARKEN